ncbi:MAG TPA: suppressor of fused domain protein [Mycobacterium sp.]|nr:suppressor of fused domain protein [Mycobacterium sp.]
MTDEIRAHLRAHFGRDPDVASVTFVGLQPIDVLRFGPDDDGVTSYVSVGGSRHAEGTPAEVAVSLRAGSVLKGLARSVAVLAAAPAVEGLVLTPDALVDLGQSLWQGAPFTAILLGRSEIQPVENMEFLQAIPITANEAAWVRLKGPDAMREAWRQDGVDVLDPARPAARPS